MADDTSEEAAAAAQPTANPTEGIKHPGINDVMFGRGGDTNYHIGNHRFRVLADDHRQEYRSASRKEKALVVQEVVRIWRARGGRFLTKTDPEKGDDSLWNDVGDFVAKKKAAKILSEKAPQERTQKGDDKSQGRKRPAVDSVDADRAAKASAVSQAAFATNQASFATAPASITAAVGASVLQQHSPAPAQLPLQLPLVPPPVAAQPTLPQSFPFQLPLSGALPSSLANLTARDILGLSRNPLAFSALSTAAGLTQADSEVSRLTIAAQVIAQQEQDANRTRLLLANALLLSNLRWSSANRLFAPSLATAPPILSSTSALLNATTSANSSATSALLNASRWGLTTDQIRTLLAASAAREEHKNNDDTNRSRNEHKPADPPSG